jgi:hypothetical protein
MDVGIKGGMSQTPETIRPLSLIFMAINCFEAHDERTNDIYSHANSDHGEPHAQLFTEGFD